MNPADELQKALEDRMFQVENMGQSKIEKALDVVAKSIEDGSLADLVKSGEGSRGGKVIGHTKSGKPIYEGGEHHKTMQAYHNFNSDNHIAHAKRIRENIAKLKKKDVGKSSAESTSIYQRELERKAKIHEDIAHIKKSVETVEKAIESGELDLDLIKGGKPAVLGEVREFGGKKYHKTEKGWRPVGKNGPKKQDEIEEKKKEFIEEREVQKLGKIKLKEGDKLKFVGGEELTQMSKHNRGGIVSVNSSKLKVSQDTIFKFVQKKDWSYSGGKLSGLLEFEYVSGPNENGVDSVVISMDGTNQFKDVKVLNN